MRGATLKRFELLAALILPARNWIRFWHTFKASGYFTLFLLTLLSHSSWHFQSVSVLEMDTLLLFDTFLSSYLFNQSFWPNMCTHNISSSTFNTLLITCLTIIFVSTRVAVKMVESLVLFILFWIIHQCVCSIMTYTSTSATIWLYCLLMSQTKLFWICA